MKILVNGEASDVQAAYLSQALQELGFHDTLVATALNGEFVPRNQRAVSPLAEGDAVEILAPMEGG